ncbi:hypothetical protein KK449_18630 [Clostridioides difficile]|nr:hypothetical protein [Clostridioides difficile]
MEASKRLMLEIFRIQYIPLFIICIVDDCFRCELKQSSSYKEIFLFFHFRGLLMPRCRSPPFYLKNKQIKRDGGNFMAKSIIFISEDKR